MSGGPRFSPPPLVRALADVLPDQVAMTYDPGDGCRKGRCVEITRLVVDILAMANIPCRAMACEVEAGNASAIAAAAAGRPLALWPADAHTLGVRIGNKTGPGGGWGGHLVAVGDTWFLDMTAVQLNRPHRNIKVPGPVIGPYTPGQTGSQLTLPGGGVIRWFWKPEVARWRTTPAWRQNIPPSLIEQIMLAIEPHADPLGFIKL